MEYLALNHCFSRKKRQFLLWERQNCTAVFAPFFPVYFSLEKPGTRGCFAGDEEEKAKAAGSEGERRGVKRLRDEKDEHGRAYHEFREEAYNSRWEFREFPGSSGGFGLSEVGDGGPGSPQRLRRAPGMRESPRVLGFFWDLEPPKSGIPKGWRAWIALRSWDRPRDS